MNTGGWIDGEGFNIIMHIIQAMSIDIVLVMSHDKLYSNLTAALKTAPGGVQQVTVVKLPRSGGVVTKVSMYYYFTFYCIILSQYYVNTCYIMSYFTLT